VRIHLAWQLLLAIAAFCCVVFSTTYGVYLFMADRPIAPIREVHVEDAGAYYFPTKSYGFKSGSFYEYEGTRTLHTSGTLDEGDLLVRAFDITSGPIFSLAQREDGGFLLLDPNHKVEVVR